jgi:hypothetical protein
MTLSKGRFSFDRAASVAAMQEQLRNSRQIVGTFGDGSVENRYLAFDEAGFSISPGC